MGLQHQDGTIHYEGQVIGEYFSGGRSEWHHGAVILNPETGEREYVIYESTLCGTGYTGCIVDGPADKVAEYKAEVKERKRKEGVRYRRKQRLFPGAKAEYFPGGYDDFPYEAGHPDAIPCVVIWVGKDKFKPWVNRIGVKDQNGDVTFTNPDFVLHA